MWEDLQQVPGIGKHATACTWSEALEKINVQPVSLESEKLVI